MQMPAPNQVKLVRWKQLFNPAFICYSPQGRDNTSEDRYVRLNLCFVANSTKLIDRNV